jgi:hypothetical protein
LSEIPIINIVPERYCQGRFAVSGFPIRRVLFAEHFCDEEDDNGSADASSEKEIQDGVPYGGYNGLHYQCNHKSFRGSTCDDLLSPTDRGGKFGFSLSQRSQ